MGGSQKSQLSLKNCAVVQLVVPFAFWPLCKLLVQFLCS